MEAERCPKPFVENGDHVWVSIPASNSLSSRPLLVCCHCREMRDGLDHRVIKPGEQPAAAPEMPRPPAVEAATEYRCPTCNRWALWTDGIEESDDEGPNEFWCQTCGDETPLESMDSRPQECTGDTNTSPAGSGRGTGVAETPGTARESDDA